MKIEIFEEDGDNTLSFGDKYADFTIDVYPESKTYQSSMNLKDDVYYRTEKFEYRIQTNPLKVETRLIERVDEPPEQYCVKDGVVLEYDILAGRKGLAMNSMSKGFIDGLKKEVEWHEYWAGNPVSMYILSKHPEIISPDDYRRHLRQFAEKIKVAVQKVEKTLESDKSGLKIIEGDFGRAIWYPKEVYEKFDDKEQGKHEEARDQISKELFDEKNNSYIGISDGEFRSSKDILENIETFLNKKPASLKKEAEPKISKTKGFIISLILTLLLSWVVSWFVDINPFLIFVIVQVIAFAQSVVGGWLGKFFE